MAHFQSNAGAGAGRQSDEYGHQTYDDYGNPVTTSLTDTIKDALPGTHHHHQTTTTTTTGVGGGMKEMIKDAIPGLHGQTAEYGTGLHGQTTGYGTGMMGGRHDQSTGTGYGGGSMVGDAKEKIKDAVHTGTGVGGTGYGGTHDQTGMMGSHGTGYGGTHDQTGSYGTMGGDMKEKIKDVVPGLHGHHDQPHHAAAPTTGEGHQKKGIMEKIKDKLPGHHH